MDGSAPAKVQNRLLCSLPPSSLAALIPMLEPIKLPLRFRLAQRKVLQEWVYFPESGVASTIAVLGNTYQEIGLFGREGAGSLLGLLTTRPALYDVEMQVAGHGYRIPVITLSNLFNNDPNISAMLFRYLQIYFVQMTHTALANTQLNIEQRLARWLLMIHDRIDGDDVHLTHEYLGIMLGVGRTGVTVALQRLERTQLINLGRARITIIERAGLERIVKSVYGLPEAEYAKAFRPSVPSLPQQPDLGAV